jgi:protein TonB
MLEFLPRVKSEKWAGFLFVLALHGAGLYGLWSYRVIPSPDEALVMMVNLISPPPPEQPRLEPPKPPRLKPVEPPKEHLHLAAETPVVLPDEPVTYVPPPAPVVAPPPAPVQPVVAAPPPAQPTVVAPPPAPPQPVILSGELSVSCPERSPPNYPLRSRRLNEQGRVLLRVELNEAGHLSDVTVKTSSGFPMLDAAAVSAVKTWRCKPAIRNGVSVPAVALQPFAFILEGR